MPYLFRGLVGALWCLRMGGQTGAGLPVSRISFDRFTAFFFSCSHPKRVRHSDVLGCGAAWATYLHQLAHSLALDSVLRDKRVIVVCILDPKRCKRLLDVVSLSRFRRSWERASRKRRPRGTYEREGSRHTVIEEQSTQATEVLLDTPA